MPRILSTLLLLTVMACSAGAPAQKPTPDDGLVRGMGVVTYLDFEGGFYGIVADDGERYEPGTLDEIFTEDGLRVRFAVRIREGVMSIRMWGTPVEVIELERAEAP